MRLLEESVSAAHSMLLLLALILLTVLHLSCLFKYCDCFSSRVKCGVKCRCYSCANTQTPQKKARLAGSNQNEYSPIRVSKKVGTSRRSPMGSLQQKQAVASARIPKQSYALTDRTNAFKFG